MVFVARPTGRRVAGLAMAALLATGAALGAGPAGVPHARADATGCDTVAASSPAPLKVHVTLAGCGSGGAPLYAASAVLAEHRSGLGIASWFLDGVTTGVDQTVDVPAAGAYDLVVDNVSAGGTYQTASVTVSDGGLVTITQPWLQLRTGTLGASAPALLDWSKIGVAGVLRYQVQRSVDGAAFATFATVTTHHATASIRLGHRYEFRVRAVNLGGHFGPWRSTGGLLARAIQESGAGWTFAGGTWTASASLSFWGGHARTATRAGRTATLSFWGSSIAFVAPVGPTRGSYRAYVDGAYRRTVSLYAGSLGTKRITYAASWATPGPHTLMVKVVGTTGHPRVDVDGAVLLDVTP